MPGKPSALKTVKDIARKEILLSLARAADGRAYVGASDSKIYELDPSKPQPQLGEFAGHTSYVTGVALAGKALVSGGWDGKLIWWDLDKRTPTRTVEAHSRWIRAVAASPDGQLIASVADDMVVRLWDAATGQKRHELRGHAERTPNHFPSMLHACAFSADGKYLATGDKLGKVVVWEAATGKQAGAVEAPTLYTWDPTQRHHSIGGVRALAFSADGKWL